MSLAPCEVEHAPGIGLKLIDSPYAILAATALSFPINCFNLPVMSFASLLDLAPELLLNIVRHLSIDQGTSQNGLDYSVEFVLRSNHLTTTEYESVVALSSTCSTIRNLLSPTLSSYLSLVRDNQIDALMASPSRLRHSSDKAGIQARYFGLSNRKSPAFGQFVSYLECDNSIIPDLSAWFPNVNSLKILDLASDIPTSQQALTLPLKDLAINVLTLANSASLLQSLPTIQRLDLLIDFFETSPEESLLKILDLDDLKHLNLFITLSLALEFEGFSCFLNRCAPKLSSLQIRLIGSNIQNGEATFAKWSSDACLESTWLDSLSDLSSFTYLAIDEAILPGVQFSRTSMAKPSTQPRAFSLIWKSLGVPRFNIDTKKTVAHIINTLGSSCFQLNYGEVIDQSYVQALNAVCDMVSFINETENILSAASLEQCWSISGQALSRDYYLLLLRNPSARNRLQACKAWDKMPFHAPRYLTQETFEIDMTKLSARAPTDFESYIRAKFWSSETSLLEHLQYSLQEKPPSGLWG